MHRRARTHSESHRSGRSGWLRAAVLGSNDAIVSTASLMVGVAMSSVSSAATLISGVAGLVAGALSMAVGEYVSVSSQRDAEQADVAREKLELEEKPLAELKELATVYEKRGLDKALALEVAKQLSAHDRLGAHLRDELGVEPARRARPFQAAWISALSFACFALVPIVAYLVAPARVGVWAIVLASLASLTGLGALGGHLGGAPRLSAALRVTLGGGLAMAMTAAVGRLLGTSVG